MKLSSILGTLASLCGNETEKDATITVDVGDS